MECDNKDLIDTTEEWDEYKCVFCKQNLKGLTSKLLPCFHNSCSFCLNEVDYTKCLVCAQDFNKMDIIDNFFMNEDINEDEQVDSKCICTSCEDNASASSFCAECAEWLCDACVQAHQRVRVTKDHTIRLKEDVLNDQKTCGSRRRMFCPLHKQEQLKLFCETCDVLTCRDCQLSGHRDHKYKFVSEACVQEKKQIERILAALGEKKVSLDNAHKNSMAMLKYLTEREEIIRGGIKEITMKSIAEIGIRARSLIKELNAIFQHKRKEIISVAHNIELDKEKMSQGTKFANVALEGQNDLALLYSKKLLLNQLTRIRDSHLTLPPNPNSIEVNFLYDFNHFAHQIRSFGTLIVGRINMPSISPALQNSNALSARMTNQQCANAAVNNYQRQSCDQQNLPPSYSQTPQIFNLPQRRPAIGNSNIAPTNGPINNFVCSEEQNTTQYQVSGNAMQPRQLSGFSQQMPPTRQNVNYNMNQQYFHSLRQQSLNTCDSQQQRSSAYPIPYSGIEGQRPPLTNSQTLPRMMHSARTPSSELYFPSQPIRHGAAELQHADYNNRVARKLPNEMQTPLPPPGQHQHPSNRFFLNQAMYQQGGILTSSGTQRLSHYPPRAGNGDPIRQAEVTNSSTLNYSNSNVDVYSTDSSQLITGNSSVLAKMLTTMPLPVKDENVTSTKPSCNDFSTIRIKQERVDESEEMQVVCQETLSKLITVINSDISTNNTCRLNSSTASSNIVQADSSRSLDFTNAPNFNCNREDSLRGRSNKKGPQDQANLKLQGPNNSQSEDPNDDWCAVCHDGGDLLCCGHCPRVYHLQCHIPTLTIMPKENENWQCRMCTPHARLQDNMNTTVTAGLSDLDLKLCEKILLELMCHDASPSFHYPVKDDIAPGYSEIIKSPMDMNTVKMKLLPSTKNHYKSVNEFFFDVRLIFCNCFLYNEPNTKVYTEGQKLKLFFEELLLNYFPDVGVDERSSKRRKGNTDELISTD